MNLRWARTLAIVFTSILLMAMLRQSSQACSRVLWKTAHEGVFVARSMDWHDLIDPRLAIYPRGMEIDGGVDHPAKWSSRFGSLVVLGVNYDGAALGGMNEQGLAADLLYLDATRYEQRNARPGVSYLRIIRYLLDNNATVSEALKSLNRIQVVAVPVHGKIIGTHLTLEDSTGDSAIIEFIGGKMVIHHGPQYAVMTNDPPYDIALRDLKQYQSFGGTRPIPGNIESIDRFIRAEYFLKYLPQPKDPEQGVAFIFQIIRNVSVPFGAPYSGGPGETYPTWWVSAADLTNRIYYFNLTRNPNVVWIDLKHVNFQAHGPVLVLDPKNPALAGDVGRGFQPETAGH